MRFFKRLLFGLLALLTISFPMAAIAQDTVAIASKNITANERKIITDTTVRIRPEFEKGFQNKYEGDEFNYEIKKPEKTFWTRLFDWLADLLRRLFTFSNPDAPFTIVEFLLKAIAVIIIIVVIFLIVKAIMNKDGQWIFGRNSDKRVIRYDEIEKNLHTANFEKLIAEALQAGEKRLSIRYYYLWLLKKMSEKQYIQWDPEKTNSDYFNEIADAKVKHQFGYLSYLYNYIWYGEFEIDDATLEKAKSTFESTIRSL